MKALFYQTRRFISLSCSLCLFIIQASPAFGQDGVSSISTQPDDVIEANKAIKQQAETNASVNQERFNKYGGKNHSECTDPAKAAEARAAAKEEFDNALANQLLGKIDSQEQAMMDRFDKVDEAEGKVNDSVNRGLDPEHLAAMKKKIDETGAEVKASRAAVEEAERVEKVKEQEYRAARNKCDNRFGSCSPGTTQYRIVVEKEKEWNDAKQVLLKEKIRYHRAKQAHRKARLAVGRGGDIKKKSDKTGKAIDANEKLADEAHRQSLIAEEEYKQYKDSIDEFTNVAERMAANLAAQAGDLEAQLQNPSDYELFDLLMQQGDNADPAHRNRSPHIKESNLEVLTMAGASVKDLRCGYGGAGGKRKIGANKGDKEERHWNTRNSNYRRLHKDWASSDPDASANGNSSTDRRKWNVKQNGGEDWTYEWKVNLASKSSAVGSKTGKHKSDTKKPVRRWTEVDSKAYHMFRAASATYLIGQMTENTDYNQQVNCMVNEKFDEGNEDYDGKNNEQVATVERATNLLDAVVENACNKVNPDPNAQVFKQDGGTELYERVKKACDEKGLGDDQIRTREMALEMYLTAYELAQREMLQKQDLVAKAHGMVMKTTGDFKRLEGEVDEVRNMILVMVLLSVFHFSLCSPTSAHHCALGAMYMGIARGPLYGSKWGKLKKKLERTADVRQEWLNRKEQAMVHTHLSCNYKDAVEVAEEHMNQAKEAEENARKLIEETKENASQGIVQNLMDSRNDIKFAYDSVLDRHFMKSIRYANSEKDAKILTQGWIRHMEGARASLPYDHTPVISNKTLDEKLATFGMHFVKRLKDTGIAIANFVLSEAHAAQPDSLDQSHAAMGIAGGSSSFMYFVERKDFQWADQSLHAYYDKRKHVTKLAKKDMRELVVDVRSARDKQQKEVTKRYKDRPDDAPQVRIVGMALPETREAHLGSIVQMVMENLLNLNEYLADAVDQRDKMVHLLSGMKNKMSLGVTGVDEVASDPKLKKSGVCMKISPSGNYISDPQCLCRQNNSCANFNYPKFGDIGTASNDSGAQLAFDAGNGALSGQLGSGNVAAGELSKNSKATRDKIKKNQAEINKKRLESGKSSIDFAKEAKNNLRSQRRSFASNSFSNNGNSVFDSLEAADTSVDPLTFSKSNRNRLLGKEGGEKEGDSKGSKSGSASGAIASAKSGSSKTQPRGEAEAIDFDLDGEEGEGDDSMLDIDLDLASANNGQGANGAEGGEAGVNGDDPNNMRAGGKGYSKGSRFKWNQIHKDRNKSLFTIITKRYKRTAYPIFLKKLKL